MSCKKVWNIVRKEVIAQLTLSGAGFGFIQHHRTFDLGSQRSPKGSTWPPAGAVTNQLMYLPQTDGLPFVSLAPVSATGPVLGAGVIHVYFEIYTLEWARPISVAA